MPVAKVQLPDGRIGRFEVPEGTTPEQVMSFASKQFSQPKESSGIGDFIKDRVESVSNAASQLTNPEFFKGIGRELTNFPEPTSENLEEIRKQASETALSTLPVTRLAGAAKSLFGKIPDASQAVRNQTLQKAGEAGFTVPRSNIKQSFLTNLGERFGGKQAVEATSQIKNQPVTNKLVAKALDLAEDTPITKEVLSAVRKEAGKAFEVVKNIGTLTTDKVYREALKGINRQFSGVSKDFPGLANKGVAQLTKELSKKTISSEGAVETVKSLRFQANANFRSLNPQEKLLAKAQRKAADVLEDLIERNIEPILGKEVLGSFRSARQRIAKTFTVENALNPATGNVVGTKLARQAAKGAPLTGELKEAANFANAFPRLAREPIGAPPSGGLFEPLVFGTVGGTLTGGPGIAAALIPIFGKPLARQLMTTTARAPKKSREILGNFLAQRGILGSGVALNEEQRRSLSRELRAF